MIMSKYTKLLKSTSGRCIIEPVVCKDLAFDGNGNPYQYEITYFLVVEQEDWDKFLEEQKQFKAQKGHEEADEKLQEACNTILNKDPFENKYSGWKLIDIYKSNMLWVDKAIKEMKNKYILERLKLIKEAVENGKIEI